MILALLLVKAEMILVLQIPWANQSEIWSFEFRLRTMFVCKLGSQISALSSFLEFGKSPDHFFKAA